MDKQGAHSDRKHHFYPGKLNPLNVPSSSASILALTMFLIVGPPASGQQREQPDFTMQFTSVAPADHPPDVFTRTGELMHGINKLFASLPLECVNDFMNPWCPTIGISLPIGAGFGQGLKWFNADERGLGVIDTGFVPGSCGHLGCASPRSGDNRVPR